jgi:hypothetical protein
VYIIRKMTIFLENGESYSVTRASDPRTQGLNIHKKKYEIWI